MKIFVTGGTGLVGVSVCRHLLANGHSVVAVGGRLFHPSEKERDFVYIRANTEQSGFWQEQIPNVDVVINLAGESILRRWNEKTRERVWQSRVVTTSNIVAAMGSGQMLMSFSATGFYGNCGNILVDEDTPRGEGFFGEVCQAWEDAAHEATDGVRVVIGRLGVVLGKGGALSKILPVFKLGMGGHLGGGHQWFPWIHLDDVVGAIDVLIQSHGVEGVVNLVSPNPVTNRAFSAALGKVLDVPTFATVPKMIINMILGEAASVLLDSQKVIPVRLNELEYQFKYPTIYEALDSVVK